MTAPTPGFSGKMSIAASKKRLPHGVTLRFRHPANLPGSVTANCSMICADEDGRTLPGSNGDSRLFRPGGVLPAAQECSL